MDFLTRRISDNDIWRQTAELPATFGESLGASFDMPTLSEVVNEGADVFEADRGITPEERGRLMFKYNPETNRVEKWSPDKGFDIPERLSPKELNEKYGDLIKFDKPMTDAAAQLLYNIKREEVIRNSILARGPGGMAVVPQFGAALLGMATDPLEVASTFIPIVGQSRKLEAIARFGAIRGRMLVGAAEGAIGNALVEPLMVAGSQNIGLDYTMTDALLNIGLGGVLGAGIGAVGGGIARRGEARAAMAEVEAARVEAVVGGRLEQIREERTAPPFEYRPDQIRRDLEIEVSRQQDVEAYRTALAQVVQGKRVDVEPALKVSGRPESLFEFIVRRGGINDADPTFRGEIAARDNPKVGVVPIAQKKSTLNLDGMAELAHETGFLRNRDVAELLQAIDLEARGERQYRFRDIGEGQIADARDRQSLDAERELSEFDAARADLEEAGYKDLSVEEIRRVAQIMRNENLGVDDAFERMAIIEEAAIAEGRVDSDFSADVRVSEDWSEAVDIDLEANDDLLAMIAEMGEEVPDMSDLTRKVAAYGDTARAAAACLVR